MMIEKAATLKYKIATLKYKRYLQWILRARGPLRRLTGFTGGEAALSDDYTDILDHI